MERYNQILELVGTFEKNFEKFYVKGSKAAGIRLRKDMQTLRKLCKEIREEVREKSKDK